MKHRTADDRGFTLPELLIAVVLMGILASVVTMAIITSIRTAPNVTSRADSSIAVQGITTFLPPDVDSTEPGEFDIAAGTASGCSGTDEGVNIVHMTWYEEFAGSTTTFVANYRFVADATGGIIQRVTCSGQFTLGPREVHDMSAKLSTTVPIVDLYDSDGDGDIDQLKITIETYSGELVFIDAASKNPAETLPPAVTNPSTTTTTTTSTTTTTLANVPPTANPTSWTVNPSTPSAFNVNATDSDGSVASVTITGGLPAGWTATPTGGTGVTLTATSAPATATLNYRVTDNAGATSANSTINVTVTTSATTTTTSTTTTTTSTTTTTTTLPPCVVSSVSASPSTVNLQSSDPSKLKRNVDVLAVVSSGYCVGLTLQYDTGAPNGQYVQNLGNAPPYDVTLNGHPQGSELWSVGVHVLEVRDGFDNLLASTTLTVIPK